MTDYTQADLDQNKKLNELTHKLEAVSSKLDHLQERLDAVHDKFKPLERIIELVENIWNKVTNL